MPSCRYSGSVLPAALRASTCRRIGLPHVELAEFQDVEAALLHKLDLAFTGDRFESAARSEQLVLEAVARDGGR
ncbi:MAG TPA: hypothetical protein VM253_08770 [Candidatus Limnocylindrales bacterium]|nr:hypothetical protein [Candidatus Limnocylindrales bacterium]